MNKRRVHHYRTKLAWLKPRYLFVLTVALALLCVFALRANNEHMVRLRDAVYTADKNNAGVDQALGNLQAYVTTHMNTDLSDGAGSVYPPIQLKYTYQRLTDAEGEQAAANNSSLYTDAQNYCQQLDPTDFSGHNRVPCIEQYVLNHDSSLQAVPTSLYEFDFVSPIWSPDLAGWSMLVAILSAALYVTSLAIDKWLGR